MFNHPSIFSWLHYEIKIHESGDFYPFFCPPPLTSGDRNLQNHFLKKRWGFSLTTTKRFLKSVKSTVEFTQVGIRYDLQIDVQFLVPYLKLGCCQRSGFSNRSDFGVRSVQSCVLLEALHYFVNNGDPGGREREREKRGGCKSRKAGRSKRPQGLYR